MHLQVAQQLVALTRGSSLAMKTSLEEVLKTLAAREQLNSRVYACLWEMVAAGVKQDSQ